MIKIPALAEKDDDSVINSLEQIIPVQLLNLISIIAT